jgi:hypothetical protein
MFGSYGARNITLVFLIMCCSYGAKTIDIMKHDLLRRSKTLLIHRAKTTVAP